MHRFEKRARKLGAGYDGTAGLFRLGRLFEKRLGLGEFSGKSTDPRTGTTKSWTEPGLKAECQFRLTHYSTMRRHKIPNGNDYARRQYWLYRRLSAAIERYEAACLR